MNYANYAPSMAIWVVIIQIVLSVYHAKVTSLAVNEIPKMEFRFTLQWGLFLILIAKYVELYSIVLNHPKLIEPPDWLLLPIIVCIYVFIQLVVVSKKSTRVGKALLCAGLLNVAVLSYFAMVAM